MSKLLSIKVVKALLEALSHSFVLAFSDNGLLGAFSVDLMDLGRELHIVHVALEFDLILRTVHFASFTICLLVKLIPLVVRLDATTNGAIISTASTTTIRLRLEGALLALSIVSKFLVLFLLALLLILFATPNQVIFVRLAHVDFVSS